MFGFSPHFAIGLLVVIPFVALDRKNRYLTLIIGGIAGVLPDIDFLGVFVDWIEHRGATHKFPTWLLASIVVLFLIFLAIVYETWRHGGSISFESFQDKMVYFGAFTLGWASHIFVDFGFTEYGGRQASIYSLDQYLSILDQGAGFVVALVLVFIIWYETREKEKILHKEAKIILSQIAKDYIQTSNPEEKKAFLKDFLTQVLLIDSFRISLGQFEGELGKEQIEDINKGLIENKIQIEQEINIKYEIKGEEIIFIHKPIPVDLGLSAKQKIIINLLLFLAFFVIIGLIVRIFD